MLHWLGKKEKTSFSSGPVPSTSSSISTIQDTRRFSSASAPLQTPRSIMIRKLLHQCTTAYSVDSTSRIEEELQTIFESFPSLGAELGAMPQYETSVVCLRGTIPTVYRGTTYNTPVIIYLLKHYPSEAPACFVSPTNSMIVNLTEHVQPDGRIVDNYLLNWSSESSLEILFSVFSEELGTSPPLYSRTSADPWKCAICHSVSSTVDSFHGGSWFYHKDCFKCLPPSLIFIMITGAICSQKLTFSSWKPSCNGIAYCAEHFGQKSKHHHRKHASDSDYDSDSDSETQKHPGHKEKKVQESLQQPEHRKRHHTKSEKDSGTLSLDSIISLEKRVGELGCIPKNLVIKPTGKLSKEQLLKILCDDTSSSSAIKDAVLNSCLLIEGFYSDILKEISSFGPRRKILALEGVISSVEMMHSDAEKESTAMAEASTKLEKALNTGINEMEQLKEQEITLRKQLEQLAKTRTAAEENITKMQAELLTVQQILTLVDNQAQALGEFRSSIHKELDTAKQTASYVGEVIKKCHSLRSLSIDNVSDLLMELGLGTHIESFRKGGVSGELLEQINDTDLITLGIFNLIERKKLLHAVWSVNLVGAVHPIPISSSQMQQVVNWDTQAVAKWLSEVGLVSFVPAFGAVTGIVLLHLCDSDIRELGISSLADKKKLLSGITALRSEVEKAFTDTSQPPPNEKLQEEPPASMLCPITMALMREPVIASDGQLYERSAIEAWLKTHNTSPMTGAQMANNTLTSCIPIRSDIREWAKQHGVNL